MGSIGETPPAGAPRGMVPGKVIDGAGYKGSSSIRLEHAIRHTKVPCYEPEKLHRTGEVFRWLMSPVTKSHALSPDWRLTCPKGACGGGLLGGGPGVAAKFAASPATLNFADVVPALLEANPPPPLTTARWAVSDCALAVSCPAAGAERA